MHFLTYVLEGGFKDFSYWYWEKGNGEKRKRTVKNDNSCNLLQDYYNSPKSMGLWLPYISQDTWELKPFEVERSYFLRPSILHLLSGYHGSAVVISFISSVFHGFYYFNENVTHCIKKIWDMTIWKNKLVEEKQCAGVLCLYVCILLRQFPSQQCSYMHTCMQTHILREMFNL